MKRLAVVVALASLAAPPASAEAPGFPRNPNIDVSYVIPADRGLVETYDRMQQLGVLQTLQEFLSPLKLQRTISVRMDQCGALSVPYKGQGPVTVCYEQLNAIRVSAPRDGFIMFDAKRKLTANQAIAGGVARLLLYETAFGVFDALNVPVWGRVDEAVDNVSALIMLDFGEDLAWASILGSAWYLAQRGMIGTGFFNDAARPHEAQRFYNYLCLAYGKLPSTYGFLVNGFNLPSARAQRCGIEYYRLSRAFRATFTPHLDSELVKRVKSRRDWLRN